MFAFVVLSAVTCPIFVLSSCIYVIYRLLALNKTNHLALHT
jgi:hypothetical protein